MRKKYYSDYCQLIENQIVQIRENWNIQRDIMNRVLSNADENEGDYIELIDFVIEDAKVFVNIGVVVDPLIDKDLMRDILAVIYPRIEFGDDAKCFAIPCSDFIK